MPTAAQLTESLLSRARELGFALAGVAPAVGPVRPGALDAWLAAGYAGEMHYLATRRAAYNDPRHVLEGVASLIVLATVYETVEPAECRAGEGRIARYAWNEDYHDVLHARMKRLGEYLDKEVPKARWRGVVDTAPLLERELGQLAGLGWIGKNTLLLNREHGSWFFLSVLLTDVVLEPSAPFEADHCGTCRACLDACPTEAFVAPYVLDARKCLSYQTIELRGAVPEHQRAAQGEWVFGCDICQEVCPWNHGPALMTGPRGMDFESAFAPRSEHYPMALPELFFEDEESFRRRFRNTPLWRAKRRGLLRNAAIVLGNRTTAQGLSGLLRGLNDSEAIVRGACAWALGRYDAPEAATALRTRATHEADAAVRAEIDAALAFVQAASSHESAAADVSSIPSG